MSKDDTGHDGRLLITLGFASIGILFLIYARLGGTTVTPDAVSAIERIGMAFYVMLLVALGAIAYGMYQYHKQKILKNDNSLLSVIAQITWNSKSRKIFLATFVSYGVFFALTSGILVYQPDVIFSKHYDVTVPSAHITPCCGEIGYVPKLIVYITEQVGLQVIPINLILQIIVSYLVGLNTSVAVNAFSILKKNTGIGGIAAVTGLFIACPTCAGTFLSLFVSASGAVAFTLAITQLQTMFIAISIPLLIITPIIMARKIRNSGWSCKIES
ncbi:hypothetical protein [Candidatus Nitrosotenuis sp. DW1]|uniref:hypothetical protein n=1 Tax=Candidatus Nitrosotenuis sp. DW1 TaxID=2259672 RepID=UPI0015C97244|nr:hypothetical protein [Candidatus Nitrosotenuis sp. DW1]QLH08840.1 hypothetical protein DSQ19_04505 [Candidatus Nitrosotenuis sp. DW1]